MSDADPIALSGGGVTVHKSYHEEIYPDPAIVIVIEQFEAGPRQVTLTESLPAGIDATLVEFDGETADHWTARGDELELIVSLADGDSIETAYAYAGGIADAPPQRPPGRRSVFGPPSHRYRRPSNRYRSITTL